MTMEKTQIDVLQSAHEWRKTEKQWKGASNKGAPTKELREIEIQLYKNKQWLRHSIDLDAVRIEKNAKSEEQP